MENELKELSKYRMEQAKQCIKSAKALVEIEDYKGAANRAYYAVFLLVLGKNILRREFLMWNFLISSVWLL